MKRNIKPVTDRQKMTIQLWLGAFIALFGVALLIAAFFCPPLAIIDASVLTAVGETFTFSGALIGIDYTYKFKHYEQMERYRHHGNPHDFDIDEHISVDEAGEGNREN